MKSTSPYFTHSDKEEIYMIALGSDHGGLALKRHVMEYLDARGLEYQDFGCYTAESCDYPDFGRAAAEAVASGACDRGIVICTTGIGISIAANKVKGIRCALCSEPLSAEMTRRHNDANMLAMGGGLIGNNMADCIVEAFLNIEGAGRFASAGWRGAYARIYSCRSRKPTECRVCAD